VTAHPTDATLDDFLAGTLTPEDILAVDDHLVDCPACRDRLAQRRDLPAAATAFRRELGAPGDHLSDAEVHGYVTGTLDATAAARCGEHLADCEVCAQQVDELRAWAAPPSRALASWRLYAVAAALAAVSVSPLIYWQTTRQPGEPASLAGLGALGPDVQTRVKGVLESGALAVPPPVRDLAGSSEVLMGASPEAALRALSPLATAVVSDRPTFTWTPLAGADRHTLAIVDDRQQPVGPPLTVTGHTVTLETPLPRGRVYTWQITAHLGGQLAIAPAPPALPAKFLIVDAATADLLARLEREHPTSHLLLGILYAQAGVRADAERHLAAVAPDDPHAAFAGRARSQIASPPGAGLKP
jgi:anti-sigma factor RsiW